MPRLFVVLAIILIFFQFALYGGLAVRSIIRHLTLEHFNALLLLWQTQTGAAFALGAALVGAWAVLHQTTAAERAEDRRQARRADALRAALPLTLSELIGFAHESAALYAALLPQDPLAQRSTPKNVQFPPLPTGAAQALTELAEASNPDHAGPMIALMRRLQIHQSFGRYAALRAARPIDLQKMQMTLTGGFIGTAELYAICEQLFSYARGEITTPPDARPPDDIRLALRVLMPFGIDIPHDVQAVLERRIGAAKQTPAA